jgi:DNA-binding CsgD family transcriptional regulator
MGLPRIPDQELLELYRQGLTNRQIADKLQVTQPAVHYRLQKLGLPNNYHKEQDVNPEQIKMLHETGLTSVGIALLLETSVPIILQHLKAMKLKDNYYRLKKVVNQP